MVSNTVRIVLPSSKLPLLIQILGRECYCGNDFAAGSVITSEPDCSFECPGNAAQKCGAGDRLSVYTQSVTITPTTEGTYVPQGCYSEPQQGANGRALSDKRVAADDMTVAKCEEACKGYTYFGLEYYTEVNYHWISPG